MRRRADWVSRFRDAYQERQAAPFQWGAHDCCLAPCDLIEAMTGCDPGRRLRGYTSARGAAAKLRALAPTGTRPADRLECVVERLAAAAGFVEVPVARAQRGDGVVVSAETAAGRLEDALALVDLSGLSVVTAHYAGGWIRLPLGDATRAWRVG